MRTVVIGDVHGKFKRLNVLLNGLKERKICDLEKDNITFLGDYIDRGENPRLVIKTIRNLQRKNHNVIALMGNHEDMCIEFFKDVSKENKSPWFFNGCIATLNDYKGHEDEMLDDLQWMENLPLYHEDDNFIYVHAGIDKRLPMEKQRRETLLWAREEFYNCELPYEKTVIFGHTPVEFLFNPEDTPVFLNGNIAIDTGCFYTDVLTALIIEDGKIISYYQTMKGSNEMKETKLNSDSIFYVCMQGFYGNRNTIGIKEDDIDYVLQGKTDRTQKLHLSPDKEEIKIPDTEDLYVIYNPNVEKEAIEDVEYYKNNNYNVHPTLTIPSENLTLWGKCIVCKKDADGNFISLEENDYPKFLSYLAK